MKTNLHRPQSFAEFIGQDQVVKNLKVFLEAAAKRKAPLDHVLLAGPPGLGKTTLAHLIAKEAGKNLRVTSGPALKRGGDLAGILSNLEEGDVLFMDEIHRLNPAVEELLYPSIEDSRLDIILGEGSGARSVSLPLKKFTLIGATTRSGLVTRPLRERFGIPLQLDFYNPTSLGLLVSRVAKRLGLKLADEAASKVIATSARGTPRTAIRLLRRIADFQILRQQPAITAQLATEALSQMGVDKLGLNPADRRYLELIASHYNGGPVGLDTLAIAMFEQKDVVEDVIEPFLLRIGLIDRTARGRVLTAQGLALANGTKGSDSSKGSNNKGRNNKGLGFEE